MGKESIRGQSGKLNKEREVRMPRPSALEKGMGDHNIGQPIVRALIAGERIPREGKAQSRTGNTSLEAQAAGGKAGKEPGNRYTHPVCLWKPTWV